MPTPDASMSWVGGLLWFAGISVAAFLVAWVLTDVFRVARPVYIGALTRVTAVLTAGYVLWSGTDAVGFVRHNWLLGVLGAAASGLVLLVAARRLRGDARLEGPARARQVLWEGLVYGAGEGMLLSVLPALVLWQSFDRLGWTGTGWQRLGTGSLAFGGTLVVIGVHHLGYREFRGPLIVTALIGCGVLSVAFLLTGSVLSACVGHMIAHVAVTANGSELPPVYEHAQIPNMRIARAA